LAHSTQYRTHDYLEVGYNGYASECLSTSAPSTGFTIDPSQIVELPWAVNSLYQIWRVTIFDLAKLWTNTESRILRLSSFQPLVEQNRLIGIESWQDNSRPMADWMD
jgi:hypothetical protein